MSTGTRHLIDPELLPALEMFPPQHVFSEDSIAGLRSMITQALSALAGAPLPPGLVRSEVFIPGPAGAPDVRALLYRPIAAEGLKPAILHIHGGGYLIGSPEINDARNRQLAIDLGVVILSVDYRLAPETRYPGALEDCYAALLWLQEQAEDLQLDRRRIALLGESAGGGLAAALALYARDRGEVAPIFQQLIAPMIDDRTAVRDDLDPHLGEFTWSQAANAFGWRALLGRDPGGPDIPAYAAAARAEALAGLPPTYIGVGALDLFVEEDMEYARRLVRAGVPVELHVLPGAFHGFELGAMTGAGVALTANAMAVAALRKALEPRP